MKRIISLILVSAMLFIACGCKEEKKVSESKVDVKIYAVKGEMPETKFKIGDDIEYIKSELSKNVSETQKDDENDGTFTFTEGEQTALIDTGNFNFYYKKANIDDGVSYIVSLGSAFGFEIGTLNVDIIEALSDYEYSAEELNDDNGFFILGSRDGKVLKYSFGEYTVSFVFIDNALSATALYLTKEW